MGAPETRNPLRSIKTAVLHTRLRRLYAAAELPMEDNELAEALSMIEDIETELQRRVRENLPSSNAQVA